MVVHYACVIEKGGVGVGDKYGTTLCMPSSVTGVLISDSLIN